MKCNNTPSQHFRSMGMCLSFQEKEWNFYRPPMKLREGTIFIGVYHSVHRGLPFHDAMEQADPPPPTPECGPSSEGSNTPLPDMVDRYASNWNAFLYILIFLLNFVFISISFNSKISNFGYFGGYAYWLELTNPSLNSLFTEAATISAVDPGFPGGANSSGGRQHTILPNFPENCMKSKEFWPP